MKLIIAITHPDDADKLIDELVAKKYQVTKTDSFGGYLKEENATILIGTEDKKVDEVLEIIKKNCQSRQQFLTPAPPTLEPGETFIPEPVEVKVGGATVFILNVEKFEQI